MDAIINEMKQRIQKREEKVQELDNSATNCLVSLSLHTVAYTLKYITKLHVQNDRIAAKSPSVSKLNCFTSLKMSDKRKTKLFLNSNTFIIGLMYVAHVKYHD